MIASVPAESRQIARPVIVTLPEGLPAGAQVLVRHLSYGGADPVVEVDVREESWHGWTPAAHVGASFVVRER